MEARSQSHPAAGLLDREAYDAVPSRVEYTPTGNAESPFPVVAHPHYWTIEHAS